MWLQQIGVGRLGKGQAGKVPGISNNSLRNGIVTCLPDGAARKREQHDLDRRVASKLLHDDVPVFLWDPSVETDI